MPACHMDEIGFYVCYIDDGGYVRLQNVGSFDHRNLSARNVLGRGRPTVTEAVHKPDAQAAADLLAARLTTRRPATGHSAGRRRGPVPGAGKAGGRTPGGPFAVSYPGSHADKETAT